jgi:hypothetical protein
MKFAVTIKKMRRIKTTSNIGVKLISSSSATALLIGDLLILYSYSATS